MNLSLKVSQSNNFTLFINVLKIKLISFSILIVPIMIFTSCNYSRCENKNPIFDEYNYDSEEYKWELLNQINKYGSDNLNYWFEDYLTINGKTYLIVKIKNNSLCAISMIRIKHWDSKLRGIIQTQGVSYKGAELKGLSFAVEKDSLQIEFVYKELEKISD